MTLRPPTPEAAGSPPNGCLCEGRFVRRESEVIVTLGVEGVGSSLHPTLPPAPAGVSDPFPMDAPSQDMPHFPSPCREEAKEGFPPFSLQ